MTQLLTLRKEVSKKLNGISFRQLRRRVRDKAAEEGILERDVALLSIALLEAKMDIQQPRFKVPEGKINALNEYLKSRGQATVQVAAGKGRKSVIQLPSGGSVPPRLLSASRCAQPDRSYSLR